MATLSPPPTATAAPARASPALRFLAAHWRIGRVLAEHLNPLLSRTYGLELRDYLVLSTVHKGISYPTELAERLKLPKDMTSRTLQTLLRGGYLERTIDVHDSRRTRLTVTDSGRTLLTQVVTTLEHALEPLLGGLETDAREQLPHEQLPQEQLLSTVETFTDQLQHQLGERCAHLTPAPQSNCQSNR